MKLSVLLAALLVAGPAFAVPPIGPRPDETEISRAYAAAVGSNDLAAYEKLFAADARIIEPDGASVDPARWFDVVAAEFSGHRRTRFLNVFSGYAPAPGRALRRFMFLSEARDCLPNATECFPQWRTETITVSGGKIIALQVSSDFLLRRTDDGAWTFYD